MKTEEELKDKIATLKAMGSPSALSKARELEWVLGIEEEPDVEADMIVDVLLKNQTPSDNLWEQLPEFVRDHQMYTFWKQGNPLSAKKPDDWDEAVRGEWDTSWALMMERSRKEKGQAFTWREILGIEGVKEFYRKHVKNKKDGTSEYEHGFYTKIPDETASIETAELISSLTKKGTHRPLLDIDFPAVVIPSTTPGHGHLYIDKEMTWKEYQRLLNLFADLGIIEHGYRGASLARGYSALRLPWVKKENIEKDIVKTFQ